MDARYQEQLEPSSDDPRAFMVGSSALDGAIRRHLVRMLARGVSGMELSDVEAADAVKRPIGSTTDGNAAADGALESLFRAMHDRAGGSSIAVAMSRTVTPSEFGLLGIALALLPTVGDVLDAARSVVPAALPTVAFDVLRENSAVRLVASTPDWCRELGHPIEIPTAMVVKLLEWNGALDDVTAIRFEHARPPWAGELEAHLCVPIEFGAGINEIRLHPRVIERRVRTADASLAATLMGRVASPLYANGFETGALLVNRVRLALRLAMPTGHATLESIARRLGLSTRSLQRSLAQSGLPFTVLLDETRHRLVRDLVSSKQLTAEEVAAQSGFSDARALRRALRRWSRGEGAR